MSTETRWTALVEITLADKAQGDPSEWPEDLRIRKWPRPRRMDW
jgi:hypothetical protein